jgi:hypothetical protein
MKTRHIALLAALLLAAPASADETKKVEVKAGKTVKVELKVPSKTEVKISPTAPVTPAVPKAVPAPAPAPVKVIAPASQPAIPVVDPDDLGGILKQIFASAKGSKWALLVGFIVMLLTWFVNRMLKQKIPTNVLPWLAIGLSTVASVAFALATGVGWLNAIIVGFQQGLVAAGSWSAVGKYIPGLKKKPTPAPVEQPAPPDEKAVG